MEPFNEARLDESSGFMGEELRGQRGAKLRGDRRMTQYHSLTPYSSGYSAQLYAGDTPEGLRPIGSVLLFRTGVGAGTPAFFSNSVPNAATGATVFAQLRAWEKARGACYEDARAAGGKFGFSPVGSGLTGPGRCVRLADFHLLGGLPFSYNGRLAQVSHEAHQSPVNRASESFGTTKSRLSPSPFSFAANSANPLGGTGK